VGFPRAVIGKEHRPASRAGPQTIPARPNGVGDKTRIRVFRGPRGKLAGFRFNVELPNRGLIAPPEQNPESIEQTGHKRAYPETLETRNRRTHHKPTRGLVGES